MPSYKDEATSKWYCKFYYEDYTGKRKQKKKRGFDTKREAQEWEREFLLKRQGDPDMTLQSLAELYLADLKARVKKSTYDQAAMLAKAYILPSLGAKVACEITPADIREWQAQMKTATGRLTGKPLKNATIHSIEVCLSSVFNYGVRIYNLPQNPFNKAGHIKHIRKKQISFWTQEEFNTFIKSVDDVMFNCLFMLLYYTGMRIGEALALTPADVDLDSLEISINKTITRDKDNGPTSPKTEGSNRVITIPAFLGDKIKEFIDLRYYVGKDDYIFPISVISARNSFYKYIDVSGVKRIRIHDLRHSHASLLIHLNYQPLLIAERLGHDNVQTTLSIYSHLYPNKHREVADKLNEQFKEISTK